MSEKVSVVAELRITYPGGQETVKSFDAAWHRMLALAQIHKPVNSVFIGFGRKD